MNHQPYEAWILEDRPVKPEEQLQLVQHLAECPHCARLSKNWAEARQTIKAAPVVTAPGGFSQRWQNSLEARRALQKRQQSRVMILSLAATGVAVALTLGILLLPPISPVTVIVNMLSTVVKLVNAVMQFWFFVASFVKAAPTGLVLSIGLLVSLWAGITVLAWSVSLYRITLKGIRTTK